MITVVLNKISIKDGKIWFHLFSYFTDSNPYFVLQSVNLFTNIIAHCLFIVALKKICGKSK